jgi:predicted ATP-grasp superfamily ATP-dependent carboligase
MRGLFGVDFILRDNVPWPVEVNPRYTASVEVLEFALGLPVLCLHRQVFEPNAPNPPESLPTPSAWIGKAILFAAKEFIFPGDGPWQADLRRVRPLQSLLAFADIPKAGQRIESGWPVLTFFARAISQDACLDALWQIAADLDRRLFAR